MIVGLLTLDLHIPESNSLKAKRWVLRSIKDRIRNKFNVSVAEVGANDLWQRSVIGVAIVANETIIINRVFDTIIEKTILSNNSVEMIDSRREML
jgi:uncharacterized protein YlxP (DUF503 family)